MGTSVQFYTECSCRNTSYNNVLTVVYIYLIRFLID